MRIAPDESFGLGMRMAKGFYRDVVAAIRAAGYAYKENAKGGHEKWIQAETAKMLIVPNPLKSRHTANAILKDAGLPKKF
jgi:predicted RNA binding protein YcfA (HicA-like mRNA interferase family)